MNASAEFESLITWLLQTAGASDRAEISEEQAIGFLQTELAIDRVTARAHWQGLSSRFQQKKIVRNGYLVQWHMFRNGFHISRLPTVDEIQGSAEIYDSTTNEELARRIRALTGVAFEKFLAAVLSRRSEYRNIIVTPPSHDGGIDFRGLYAPDGMPPTPLIGQAKQVSSRVDASVARDFIGALDTAHERKVFGLLVSTAGFTGPALQVVADSHFHIACWDMGKLLEMSRVIITRKISLSFAVPDQTFWDEVSG